jgi:murein DD-endopeptidase MepM/ murein hydrolase activator NlpD
MADKFIFWRHLALLCAVCLASMLLLVFWSSAQPCRWSGEEPVEPYPDALERKNVALGSLNILEHSVKSGEVLYAVLAQQGLPPQQIRELLEASHEVFDLRRASPGDKIRLYCNRDGEVEHFELRRSGSGEALAINRTPLGLVACRREPSYVTRLALAEGTINSSLYADGVHQGLDSGLVMQLADVFAWDIDFLSDVRPGDSFRIIYEQQLAEIGPPRSGRILAAEVINSGRVHVAYYFEDGESHADYYDAKGHSLRKEFLKSPLRYKRISAGFSHSRLHPILKIRRPHLGVDYAAPPGTPVEAVADGRIVYRGRNNGFGNYVEIRHRRGITTSYGHLQGFAPGLKQGDLVRQGQVIGFVGSTGLATGPHLDFRVAERGVWIDPLKRHGHPAEPVRPAMRDRFEAFVTEVHSRFPDFVTCASR